MRNCAFAEKIQIIKQFMAGASDLISVAFCALLLRDMEIMKFNAIHIEWIILSWQRSLCRLAFIFPPHQFYLSSHPLPSLPVSLSFSPTHTFSPRSSKFHWCLLCIVGNLETSMFDALGESMRSEVHGYSALFGL